MDTVETWEAPAHTHAIGCWTVITITCKLFCKRNSPGLYMVLMHAQSNCLIQDDVDNEMEHSNPSEEIHCAIPSIRIYRAMGEQISVVYVPQSSSFIMCVLIATHPTLPIISRLLMFTENVSSAVGRLAARDRTHRRSLRIESSRGCLEYRYMCLRQEGKGPRIDRLAITQAASLQSMPSPGTAGWHQ